MTSSHIEYADAQRLLNAAIRSDFLAFAKKVYATLAPGQPMVEGWYLRAIAYQLERCFRGEIRRLIINIPPRHLKSIMASVALPAYLLGHDPTARIICASYSGDLASKHAGDCRRIMRAPWYQSAFPGTRIGKEKDTELDFVTSQLGYRLATSVGGTLTGRGGNFLIVDDPLKPEEALSEVRRRAANDWYDNTLFTRLDNKSTGVIIIVMQRLHLDDLVGHVLAKGEEWTVLSLPAIAEEAENVPTGPGPNDSFHRGVGDLLDPARENMRILNGLKQTMGSYNFSAQYQQNPIPVDGEVFRKNWFLPYDTLPRSGYIVQSWDTAMKDTELNNFSVCTTWLMHDGIYYLVDVFRQRLQFPALLDATRRQQEKFKPAFMLIEDKGSGTSLIQALRAGGHLQCQLTRINPEKDKVVRAAAQSAAVEAGRVRVPKEAPWLAPFMREILQFPNARHDDQVDSMSQFLEWATRPRGARTVRIQGV